MIAESPLLSRREAIKDPVWTSQTCAINFGLFTNGQSTLVLVLPLDSVRSNLPSGLDSKVMFASNISLIALSFSLQTSPPVSAFHTLISHLRDFVTNELFMGFQAAKYMGSFFEPIVCSSFPVVASQTFTTPSKLVVAINLLSRLKRTPKTVSDCGPRSAIKSPVLALHNRGVALRCELTIKRPSGLNSQRAPPAAPFLFPPVMKGSKVNFNPPVPRS